MMVLTLIPIQVFPVRLKGMDHLQTTFPGMSRNRVFTLISQNFRRRRSTWKPRSLILWGHSRRKTTHSKAMLSSSNLRVLLCLPLDLGSRASRAPCPPQTPTTFLLPLSIPVGVVIRRALDMAGSSSLLLPSMLTLLPSTQVLA